MSNKLTGLSHLRSLATSAKSFAASLASNIATATVAALDEMNETKANKASFVTFSIAASGWKANGAAGSGYEYYALVTAPTATSRDGAAVTLSVASLAASQSCSICPTVEVLDGALRFWASEVPNITISGVYQIIAAMNETEE